VRLSLTPHALLANVWVTSHRLGSAAEQLGLRIAKAFENNIDDERGWHMELLRRLSLTIPGIRPRLFWTQHCSAT
jgi:hypothetical protein